MRAMSSVDVHAFANEWIAAWNAHDLERVLTHYADDVELVSPRAAQVVPESGGVIRGKPALHAYWTKAMGAAPTLRFEMEDVFATVSGATLLYRNHRGQRVTETFLWNAEGLVIRTVVAHAAAAAAATATAAGAAAETETGADVRATALPRSAPAGDLYCMIARVPAAGVPAFLRYEEGVLPLLAEHGATLEQRMRSNGDGDGTGAAARGDLVEIHVVRFPDAAALAAYRADSRRATMQPALADSGASIELLPVRSL
jgi:ketosteroid isomerase-like protein